MDDLVNQPAHYKTGGIETIDFIKAKLSHEAYVGYCCGNVLKYISRHEHKNGLEDLKKAKVYLEWMIQAMTDHQKSGLSNIGMDNLCRGK